MKKFTRFTLFASLLLLTGYFAGCDRDIDTRPIPTDLDPGIALETPDRSNFLRRIGETVELTLRITDNEALKVFRVAESVFNADGDTLLLNSYRNDELIDGEVVLKNFVYTVPIDVQGVLIDPYSSIKLTFYAIDTKGASASTSVLIDVLGPQLPDPPYPIRQYNNNRMIHPNSFSGGEDFNFYDPSTSPVVELDMDVKIVDETPGPLSGKSLVSPNNALLGRDSVFVQITDDRFNFDSCTYTTIQQAWYSGNPISSQVPMPEVGEMLIIRLSKTNNGVDEQFAVMKVTEFRGNGSTQSVLFDFKVTN
jgi:hypothetical protein